MGDTWMAGITYPELNDNPNVPRDMQELAEDCDRELYRMFPCTSTTRPNDPRLRTNVMIREVDTGKCLMWDGTQWVEMFTISGGSIGGVGGGGGSGGSGAWHSATAQAIGTANTILAAATEDLASGIITRSTQGSGHKWTLTEAGIYDISAELAFSSSGIAGKRYLQLTNPTITVGHAVMGIVVPTTTNDCALQVSKTKRFAAGDQIVFCASQTGQTTLNAQLLHVDIAKVAA